MANKGSRILLASLAGVAAGIVIGMMFAPAKGSKTRKRLKEGIRELSTDDGRNISEKIKSLTSLFHSTKENPAKGAESEENKG